MALVQAYKTISDPHEQQTELAALIKTLPFSRVRKLRQLLHPDNFRCDIIGRLPPELSQLVIQHLPLYQVFQSRRVSRSWQGILSTGQVIKQALGQWYPADHASSNVLLTEVAQRADAYQQGNPLAMTIVDDISYSNDAYNSTHVAHADGILAWIDCECLRSVEILDVQSGFRKRLTTPNRDKLSTIAVSSTIAAVLSESAKCYIWRIGEGTLLRAIQLHSAGNKTMLVAHSTMVLFSSSLEGSVATGELLP